MKQKIQAETLSFDQKIKLLNQLKHKLVRVDGYQQAKENYEQFISGQKQVGDLQASQQVMEQLCENPSERSAVLKDLFTKTFIPKKSIQSRSSSFKRFAR